MKRPMICTHGVRPAPAPGAVMNRGEESARYSTNVMKTLFGSGL